VPDNIIQYHGEMSFYHPALQIALAELQKLEGEERKLKMEEIAYLSRRKS